ncbi:MAG: DNA cytosine methyltransferase [Candidatus Aenigmarchaeota archaeon]|nr:DNA cytosine methyltransferase [Candidatus Aenigmarchaeota archaeon]
MDRGGTPESPAWRVIDLFSGAGGMSFGFHAHDRFTILGAVDAEIGKPSTGFGALDCNTTYEANIGLRPESADLQVVDPADIASRFYRRAGYDRIDVLTACPPCTGFSRTIATNHVRDDPRNSLVARCASFVRQFRPRVFIMENARELLTGKFRVHFDRLQEQLDALGYDVEASTHVFTRFGLPQVRERALVIAAERPLQPRTLDALWERHRVHPEATTVRRAIGHLPALSAGATASSDPAHTSTHSDGITLRRLKATPRDGGSWVDWVRHEDAASLLIPAMKRSIQAGTLNHFCDVYGRMAWDRPAPTVKRECSHIGNGRYAHPEQDRLCSVREMAILQGFPSTFSFKGKSRKNMYRAIGDAVPPLISFQLAHLAAWILSGERPDLSKAILPNCHIIENDLVESTAPRDRQLRLFNAPTAYCSTAPPE